MMMRSLHQVSPGCLGSAAASGMSGQASGALWAADGGPPYSASNVPLAEKVMRAL